MDSEMIQVTVNEVNESPGLDTIDDETVDEGTMLSFTATATDPDLPANALTFSLDPGAPTGASIDPQSGVFSWTPAEAQGPDTSDSPVGDEEVVDAEFEEVQDDK